MLSVADREAEIAGLVDAQAADEDRSLIAGTNRPRCLLAEPALCVGDGPGNADDARGHVSVADQIGGPAPVEGLPSCAAVTGSKPAGADWAVRSRRHVRRTQRPMKPLPIERHLTGRERQPDRER